MRPDWHMEYLHLYMSKTLARKENCYFIVIDILVKKILPIRGRLNDT
jgi:hypothetical protein